MKFFYWKLYRVDLDAVFMNSKGFVSKGDQTPLLRLVKASDQTMSYTFYDQKRNGNDYIHNSLASRSSRHLHSTSGRSRRTGDPTTFDVRLSSPRFFTRPSSMWPAEHHRGGMQITGLLFRRHWRLLRRVPLLFPQTLHQ